MRMGRCVFDKGWGRAIVVLHALSSPPEEIEALAAERNVCICRHSPSGSLGVPFVPIRPAHRSWEEAGTSAMKLTSREQGAAFVAKVCASKRAS